MTTRSVMILDDETNMRWVLGRALEQAGYTVHSAATGDEGLSILSRTSVDLVLLDLKLKGEDGLIILRRLRERRPELVVMLLTAYGTVANAVEAMQLGAADFLRKPFDVEEVTFKVARALERRTMQQELARLAAAQRTTPAFEFLIGASPAWQHMLVHARTISQRTEDVLLIGEPGSGRGLIASAIHGASTRAEAPFVTYDPHMYQSHMRSNAFIDREGAHGAWVDAGQGTLLIEGVEDEPAVVELLRETLGRSVSRNGPRILIMAQEELSIPIAVRDLLPLCLRVPPLRERTGDVVLLASHFIGGKTIAPAALHALEQYAWPNNVAEVRAVMVRALELAGDEPINLVHLPEQVRQAARDTSDMPFRLPDTGVNLDAVEQTLIRQALERSHGNKTKAAELLSLTRHTLLYRMEKYGITGSEQG